MYLCISSETLLHEVSATYTFFFSLKRGGVRIANPFIQIGTSHRVLWIIWFRSGLRSSYRKIFDSVWNFRAGSRIDSDQDFGLCIVNHLIRIRTSERLLWIFRFRLGLRIAYCESFRSGFQRRFANHLIQIRTSEHVLWIFRFGSGLWIAYRKSFDSDMDFRVRITNRWSDREFG